MPLTDLINENGSTKMTKSKGTEKAYSNKKRTLAEASHELKGTISGKQSPEKTTSNASCAMNMVVMHTLIILLSAENGLQAASLIRN